MHKLKILRIVFFLLCLVELGCLIGVSPGSRPNSADIRRALLRWKQDPSAENSTLLHGAIDEADNRYRSIRVYSMWGLLVNTMAIILIARLVRANPTRVSTH